MSPHNLGQLTEAADATQVALNSGSNDAVIDAASDLVATVDAAVAATGDTVRRAYKLADGDTLQVALTDEGVIIDAYDTDGELAGTSAQLATDLHDDLTSSPTPTCYGPALDGLLTILADRGYTPALMQRALDNYGGPDAVFFALAGLADRLEDAFASDPARECDDCGTVEDASGPLDWTNGSCPDCDPSVMDAPINVERLTAGGTA